MRRMLLALLFSSLAGSAYGALTPAEISAVSVSPPPGARAPLDQRFQDDQGRPVTLRQAFGGEPVLLIFADYTCTSLCGPALVLTKAGLEAAHLKPGLDYRLVIVGLNPKDGPATARAMRRERLGDDPALNRATQVLIGDPGATRVATTALGYHYVYDPQHNQYAHPTVAFAFAPDGRLTRVVSEIGLTGAALRLALVEAGEGRIGTVIDRLHVLCYGFDPASGLYNGAALTGLRWAAAGLLAAGAAALVLMNRRRRTLRP